MRRQSLNKSDSKIVFYAIGLVVILGIILVVVQDIKVPTEHVSQEIKVTLDK